MIAAVPNFHFSRQSITTLCISLTASLLLVGTSTGAIHIYDIPSHQLLRTISSYKDKGLSITYIATLLKPPDLIGHVSLNLGSMNGRVDGILVKPVLPFQRMRDAKSRELHEVSMLLPVQNTVSAPYCVGSIFERDLIFPQTPTEHAVTPYSTTSPEFLQDHIFFVQPSDTMATSGTAVSLQSRVTSLEGQVSELHEQLGKAKGINDIMWETIVQKVIPLADGKDKKGVATGEDDQAESERRKKRGRV
jgi:pre-rRNA-processing protein IPI3